MRIIDCLQGSEEWDRWRNRPTASEFDKFITPVKGEYSASATKYAAKIVAKMRGIYQETFVPSAAMDWGSEHEPNAKHAYTKETGRAVVDVGFVLPDKTDAYGCSPDGLVDDDGQIEVKCPSAETLIVYHDKGEFPTAYKPQVQGQLLITGREWCDFYVWHPLLTPFLIRVEPDLEYQEKIADGLLELLREIDRLEKLVPKMKHELVSVTATSDELEWKND